jgi:putative endonuclease
MLINVNKRAKGNVGENIVCRYLLSQKFRILDRNYLKKWGELDIVAEKGGAIHFFEIKSVTYDSLSEVNSYRPEENVHGLKVRHLRRIIETYLAETGLSGESEFYFHVICVYMDLRTRKARLKWLQNVIL